jgi:hypothetical protein
LKRDQRLEPALGLATIVFACVAAVRVLGMALDDAANFFHGLALFIELATFALASIAWRGLRHTRQVSHPAAGAASKTA